ncbi:hypothetical protein XENORESO_002195 [Xenotaenia resolanae]|uniref:Uncharacterized protein n=1 Tax=Xenotaenia resolanae TaxID=208358 RepID=A0ABV0WQK8_9TELE
MTRGIDRLNGAEGFTAARCVFSLSIIRVCSSCCLKFYSPSFTSRRSFQEQSGLGSMPPPGDISEKMTS